MNYNQTATFHDQSNDPELENKKKWLSEQQAALLKYCRTKELDVDRLLDKHYAAVIPHFALFGVVNRKEDKKYWVITGDVPHDHVSFDVAKDPREALRHLSMSWQLKAENMEVKLESNNQIVGTKEQYQEMIALLRNRAQNLYEIVADEKAWPKIPSN